MAFTRPWDDTFPPDTQQANLLGQDIRRDKEDTAERIRAFGAGKIANRETPEADFGNANIGAVFFAEDEGRLYRWNGSAWNRIAVSQKFVDTSLVSIIGDSTEQVGNQVTIPANVLAVGDQIEIVARAFGVSGSIPIGGIKIQFGSTIVAIGDIISLTENSGAMQRATVMVLTATTQRSGGTSISFTASLTSSTGWLDSPAENIASAILVRVVATTGPGQNWNSDMLVVRILG